MDDALIVARNALVQGEREAMVEWLAGMRPWDRFVTFTYDPVKVLRARGHKNAGRGDVALRRVSDSDNALAVTVGLQKIRRDMNRFVAESARAEGRCLDLVAGFEPHESGSLHAHALAFFRGRPTGHEIESLHGAWFKRHGRLLVLPVQSVDAVAEYVAKQVVAYSTKAAADLFFSERLGDR